MNVALSVDGKISSVEKRPADWTSAADKQRLRELRIEADALLVGRGTWQADRMKMRVAGKWPLRCVVSRSGHFDPAHPMFRTDGGPIHLVSTSGPIDTARYPAGVTAHRLGLADFLEKLHADLGARRLHCEGGGELIRELAGLDAIDELHATWCAHTLFGGGKAPTATGIPADFLPGSRRFRLTHFEPVPETDECFLSYQRQR